MNKENWEISERAVKCKGIQTQIETAVENVTGAGFGNHDEAIIKAYENFAQKIAEISLKNTAKVDPSKDNWKDELSDHLGVEFYVKENLEGVIKREAISIKRRFWEILTHDIEHPLNFHAMNKIAYEAAFNAQLIFNNLDPEVVMVATKEEIEKALQITHDFLEQLDEKGSKPIHLNPITEELVVSKELGIMGKQSKN